MLPHQSPASLQYRNHTPHRGPPKCFFCPTVGAVATDEQNIRSARRWGRATAQRPSANTPDLRVRGRRTSRRATATAGHGTSGWQLVHGGLLPLVCFPVLGCISSQLGFQGKLLNHWVGPALLHG